MKIQKITYIRHGKCEPDKCGSACCRLLNNKKDKAKFKPTKGICKFLKKGKCSIYKDRPEECKDFPTPNHPIYKQVESICTYWFERKVEEIEE